MVAAIISLYFINAINLAPRNCLSGLVYRLASFRSTWCDTLSSIIQLIHRPFVYSLINCHLMKMDRRESSLILTAYPLWIYNENLYVIYDECPGLERTIFNTHHFFLLCIKINFQKFEIWIFYQFLPYKCSILCDNIQ